MVSLGSSPSILAHKIICSKGAPFLPIFSDYTAYKTTMLRAARDFSWPFMEPFFVDQHGCFERFVELPAHTVPFHRALISLLFTLLHNQQQCAGPGGEPAPSVLIGQPLKKLVCVWFKNVQETLISQCGQMTQFAIAGLESRNVDEITEKTTINVLVKTDQSVDIIS